MKNLTKILANIVTVPLALGILASPLYACSKKKAESKYEQFMKYDLDGDGVVDFNEYLVGFIDKDKKTFEKAKQAFEVYDLNMNFRIDKKDKELNGE